jgi:hypothetical protein
MAGMSAKDAKMRQLGGANGRVKRQSTPALSSVRCRGPCAVEVQTGLPIALCPKACKINHYQ